MTENKQIYLYKANGLTATVVILTEARNGMIWVKVLTALGAHWVDGRELVPIDDEFTEELP